LEEFQIVPTLRIPVELAFSFLSEQTMNPAMIPATRTQVANLWHGLIVRLDAKGAYINLLSSM